MNLCGVIGFGSFVITVYAFIRIVFIERALINNHCYHAIRQNLSLIRKMIADADVVNDPPVRKLLKKYYWHRILKNAFIVGFVYNILAILHIAPVYL